MRQLLQAAIAAVAFLGGVAPAQAQVAGIDLLVGNYSGFSGLDGYSGIDGSYKGVFVRSGGAQFSYFKFGGPNNNLFVLQGGNILQFSSVTGNFVNVFNSSQLGGQFCFGPDNNLYRLEPASPTQFNPPAIGKYDGATGVRLATFVASNNSGITAAGGAMRFGPNGNLYVDNDNTILGFNGVSGAPTGPFIPPSSGGLGGIQDAVFASTGELLVAGVGVASDRLYRFDGSTGAYLGVFASGHGLDGPTGITQGPDGRIYVASTSTDSILRFDASTGAFVDSFITQTTHSGPSHIAFTPFPVPEPSSALYCLIGATGVANWYARHRRLLKE